MRRYYCPNCSNEVHSDNTVCVQCANQLAYSRWRDQFIANPSLDSDGLERNCANRSIIGCNWLVENGETSQYCSSCRHTLLIPDLSTGQNVERWAKLERSKRMLFYGLHKFHLPMGDAAQPTGLRFEFKQDLLATGGQQTKVITGHDGGLITINIAEADDDVREQHRVAMGEPYRTLIGHFRHEVGHYYWDRLVLDGNRIEDFRAMFGDERADYAAALQRHYQLGAPAGWELSYVSSYASAHPWEDFAETWAHYFHMVDGLETAQSYAVAAHAVKVRENPYETKNFEVLIKAWVPLTIAMNAVNRSIGNPDFYPFVLSQAISAKLQFVHHLIHDARMPSP
jgi:hypothetical protein